MVTYYLQLLQTRTNSGQMTPCYDHNASEGEGVNRVTDAQKEYESTWWKRGVKWRMWEGLNRGRIFTANSLYHSKIVARNLLTVTFFHD